MAYSANASRRVVIRANRETIALVLGACALTFVIAYELRGRATEPSSTTIVAAAPPQQDWTGNLADVPQNATTTAPAAEPLSSDSLTVPKSQLALPPTPAKAKVRPCDLGPVPCATGTATAKIAAPVPPVRKQAATAPTMVAQAKAENDHGLMSTLNPLNHMPEMSTIKRPFIYAGDTVSGWFKRF